MRIENLRLERQDGTVRVMADIIWEDSDRPTQIIYYETDERFADDLICDPHTFVVGSVLPARRNGEKRIIIDEVVCPELTEGLGVAMRWLDHWRGRFYQPIQIEAKGGLRMPAVRSLPRTGAFLSGGLDSLALLGVNRTLYPPAHPKYVRDGLIIHGFDIGGLASGDTEAETFERAVSALSTIAGDAGVTVIPVRTNVRHLDDGVEFWVYEFHGAALASVAHAFSRRLSLALLASGREVPDIEAGSHPVLVPNYGSSDLKLHVEGLGYSRLARTKIVANWNVALQNLRVCTHNPPDRLNCGVCEKCIRTMTELIAVGKLSETEAFGARNVSTDLLETITINEPYQDAYYRELIEPLTQQGRHDLVRVIARKRAEYERYMVWKEERDWKGAVKRFDRRWSGGLLFRSYSTMRRGMKALWSSTTGA